MRAVSIVVVIIVVAALGLSFYLTPNDLAGCGTSPDTSKSNCHTVDAIVAVSGGDTSARTEQAIQLYQDGWAPLIVFSGAAQDKSGPSNALAMKRQAESEGVPETAILIEEDSATTRQNAAQTAKLLKDHHLTSIILVTSAYHQRRASLEFQRATDRTVTILNHPVESDHDWSRWWWLTPRGWWFAVSELGGIIAFYLGVSR